LECSEAQVALSLLKNGLFIQRTLNQVCQEFGLGINQFCALSEIISRGPLSQKELCERLLFEKSNISKIVKALLQKKLITVATSPADRRLTLLIETAQGYELWKGCLQNFHSLSREILSGLAGGELLKAAELLAELEQKFRSMTIK